MRAALPVGAALAASLGLHALALSLGDPSEPVRMEAGAGAEVALLGNSFEDMVSGRTVPVAPVAPEAAETPAPEAVRTPEPETAKAAPPQAVAAPAPQPTPPVAAEPAPTPTPQPNAAPNPLRSVETPPPDPVELVEPLRVAALTPLAPTPSPAPGMTPASAVPSARIVSAPQSATPAPAPEPAPAPTPAAAPVPDAPAEPPPVEELAPLPPPDQALAATDPGTLVETSPRPPKRPERKQADAPPEPKKAEPKKQAAAPPREPAWAGGAQDARKGQSDGKTAAKSPVKGQGGKAAESGNAAAANYPGQVMKKLSRTSRPRIQARGTALVAFTVSGDGGVAGVRIAKSSGNPEVDNAALTFVRRAAPFPAPPAGAQRDFSFSFGSG